MSRRWVCLVVGHRYRRVRYPGSDAPDGWYLHCDRCQHERDEPPGLGHLMREGQRSRLRGGQ